MFVNDQTRFVIFSHIPANVPNASSIRDLAPFRRRTPKPHQKIALACSRNRKQAMNGAVGTEFHAVDGIMEKHINANLMVATNTRRKLDHRVPYHNNQSECRDKSKFVGM